MIAGHLLQKGSPGEIYRSPVSREVGEFVGGGSVLPGEVRNGVATCELGVFPVDAAFSGPADIMFRAEGLTLAEDGAPATLEAVEYFGHDQLITVRLESGSRLRIRLLAAPHIEVGEPIGVAIRGEVLAFPRSN